MQKINMTALDDLEMSPHTWTKGLDYEVIQKDDYFVLASNEGQTNIIGTAKEKLISLFEIVKG